MNERKKGMEVRRTRTGSGLEWKVDRLNPEREGRLWELSE